MGALREPKLLKLEVRTPQNMVLYSKSATTSLSNLCYNCIGNVFTAEDNAAFPQPEAQQLLNFYTNYRKDIITPGTELFRLKQIYDENPTIELRRKK